MCLWAYVGIPRLTVGNEATDSLFDSEAVQLIMEIHYDFIRRFREHECSDKIKKAAKFRSSKMNDRFYEEGLIEDVMVTQANMRRTLIYGSASYDKF